MSNINDIIAGIGLEAHNKVTFDASTGKVGTVPLFNVTGLVAVKIYAVGVTTPVSGGGGTLAVGTATAPSAIITTTTATGITALKNWWNASPAAATVSSNVTEFLVDENIILTVATAAITAGAVRLIAIWRPISADGYLVSANLGGSASPSMSPSASASPSSSVSPSASQSLSPSSSISPSASRSPSSSSSASLSPSASRSPSSSVSPSSSASPSMDLI